MVKNHFDRIVPVYDGLKKVVFGNTLDHASAYFLQEINNYDKVLIVGGGTGEILNALNHVNEIDYIDLSGKMLEKARKNAWENIRFYHHDFLRFERSEQYDVIIFPFFLDVLDQGELESAIFKSRGMLKKEGFLIVSDFELTKIFSQRMLIKLMYIFFRLSVNMTGKRLFPIHKILLKAGFREKKAKFYCRGMIFSRLYVNSETL